MNTKEAFREGIKKFASEELDLDEDHTNRYVDLVEKEADQLAALVALSSDGEMDKSAADSVDDPLEKYLCKRAGEMLDGADGVDKEAQSVTDALNAFPELTTAQALGLGALGGGAGTLGLQHLLSGREDSEDELTTEQKRALLQQMMSRGAGVPVQARKQAFEKSAQSLEDVIDEIGVEGLDSTVGRALLHDLVGGAGGAGIGALTGNTGLGAGLGAFGGAVHGADSGLEQLEQRLQESLRNNPYR